MAVWIPDSPATLRVGSLRVDDNAQRFASAKASHTFERDSARAPIDGLLPRSSSDTSIPRWTSWPRVGEPQTVEFELAPATPVQSG